MIHLIHFSIAFTLSCLADYLAVRWVSAISRRDILTVVATVGTNKMIVVVVSWLAFVCDSIPAAGGMVLGAMFGSFIGVSNVTRSTRDLSEDRKDLL